MRYSRGVNEGLRLEQRVETNGWVGGCEEEEEEEEAIQDWGAQFFHNIFVAERPGRRP